MDDAIEAFVSGAFILAAVGLVVTVVFFFAWMHPSMSEAKYHDCSLVEFSPDVPANIKQACRELRMKK